ncbi:uncharacterized protein LOC144103534 [Amblyomma americanum]
MFSGKVHAGALARTEVVQAAGQIIASLVSLELLLPQSRELLFWPCGPGGRSEHLCIENLFNFGRIRVLSFQENDIESVRELINCTNFDTEYKVLALTYLLNDAVASTLPEEERNQSLSRTDFIVRWCSTGNPLPTFLYNLTCEDYLGMVQATCGKPVTFNVPDIKDLGQCAQNHEIEQLCTEGQPFTWKAFSDLVNLLRCIYFSIMPLLPFLEYYRA